MKCPFVSGTAALALIASTPFAERIWAQTVQLPTFHRFGIVTTVVVPASGVTYAGGNALQGIGGRGVAPGAGRGFGGSHVAGGVWFGATIIDNDELDRAVLAEAARRRGAAFDILGRPVVGGQSTATSYRNATSRAGPLRPTAISRPPSRGDDEPLILVRPSSSAARSRR